MGRVVSVLLFIVLIVSGIYFIRQEDNSLISPIPKVFGTSKVAPVALKNGWLPKNDSFDTDSGKLNISAASAIAVDYESGKIIFQKAIDRKQPVASTVKIMTALVALENADSNKVFTVSERASTVGENSMGLTGGEKLNFGELLLGLMLVSGNDAAVTIAENVSNSEDVFVSLMNEKAKFLGMNNTKFTNSSGLDDDNNEQYSTAYDMAVLARYTWENYPLFRETASTFHEFIDATQTHKAFDLYNDTNLLTTYPGVRGIKPGFTWEAGLCLVTYAENDGKKIIAVILGSNDRRGEMKELLDYSFGTFGIKVPHPALD